MEGRQIYKVPTRAELEKLHWQRANQLINVMQCLINTYGDVPTVVEALTSIAAMVIGSNEERAKAGAPTIPLDLFLDTIRAKLSPENLQACREGKPTKLGPVVLASA